MSETRVREGRVRREKRERERGIRIQFNSIRGYISNPKIFEEDGRSRKREIETNAH